MKVICHFAVPLNDTIRSILVGNKIPYHEFTMPCNEIYASFDVLESSPAYSHLIQTTGCTPIKNVKFSDDEMQSAKWLTCTPINAKLSLRKEDISFTLLECYGEGLAHHRIMSGAPFYVAAPISRKSNQHFFTADETPHHLFCTEHAKKLLEERKLPLDYRAVQHYRTGKPIGDLYDIRIPISLPMDALELSNSEETFLCPVCGKRTFLPPLQLKIRSTFLKDMPEICATMPVFSWGGNYAAPFNLISHDLFLFLTKNKLARGLSIEPVALIE